MIDFAKLPKLHSGDAVAILSPSFAAPAKWPYVYELGLQRIRNVFNLVPVEYPTTKKIGASKEERTADLYAAFENKDIKGVISTLGGDDQVTYIKNLNPEVFVANPKPFFGYSDNSHLMNFLWLNGIPSYYGGALFTQFAEQNKIHEFTLRYLKFSLFEYGEIELTASPEYNDIGLNWDDPENLRKQRTYENNPEWFWSGNNDAEGITWGGCLESIDEMLRHGIDLPSLSDFENVVLIAETSEEIPTSEYVFRVFRALGERGIIERVKGILIGRPKAWTFDKQWDKERKDVFRKRQRNTIEQAVRQYNSTVTIVQNMDFGHTDPQIPIPYGSKARIDATNKKVFVTF